MGPEPQPQAAATVTRVGRNTTAKTRRGKGRQLSTEPAAPSLPKSRGAGTPAPPRPAPGEDGRGEEAGGERPSHRRGPGRPLITWGRHANPEGAGEGQWPAHQPGRDRKAGLCAPLVERPPATWCPHLPGRHQDKQLLPGAQGCVRQKPAPTDVDEQLSATELKAPQQSSSSPSAVNTAHGVQKPAR